MTPEIEAPFPKIGQALVNAIGGDYMRAWIYAEVTEDHGNVTLYFESPESRLFEVQPGTAEYVALYQHFEAMWELVRERGPMPWSTATFSLQRAGSFTIDYGYEDVSDPGEFIERQEVWEKRHFGSRPVEPR